MKTEEEIKKEIKKLQEIKFEEIKKPDNWTSINIIDGYIVALEWVLDNE